MSRVPGRRARPSGCRRRAPRSPSSTRSTGTECLPAPRIDDGGRLLDSSEAIGEIVSRNGAQRFEGYYANDEAEAERTRGGWFWSGDLGYRDEAGFFYFAGRPADWLRVDGENFAAAPVERILARLPGVVTAAVYPVPDPRTGDQVMATLELAAGGLFDPAGPSPVFLAAQEDLGTKWAPRSSGSRATSPSPARTRSTSAPCARPRGSRTIPCGGGRSSGRGGTTVPVPVAHRRRHRRVARPARLPRSDRPARILSVGRGPG